ncbi:5-(carboxyamino)imidazole ribonucleotide synthase [Bifidobacterium mongoliense]|uniref:5-(carboxyamino)imidazole ribonucleotide synthase n=1 Tax=Bifidobacterium mongoliense TaxID=518643 RepID=UPI00264A3CB2|nr:5-(carboxyamino)imidazole ribonucleotide synthase [Bifidobacterium mongoliense]MDN5632971.1 5-(carboxyamino)imidazole ribonucleotide synthase [Bifidobacterium mongoliense]MDN6025125.1 5-(carboxyamino)imidazole ribonucleotide synthase [Bifidobacterium mongoliense]MDN6050907.1 5-(carboxyamino)imidazole ribonucleotide synthase [Bifidobacterium mongoliense]MDN6719265.1 5-(carboxyamino)imidazole ribonucleotide synthase [Bifidobacterium mongoliense]
MPSLHEETHGKIDMLMPGACIGIIGGGQLGQMMAISAKYHGFRVGVLDPTPDCPTAQVADFQITAAYDDRDAIRQLAERSDVLTYEFENVDADAIDQARDLVSVPQGTDLLRVTQDRVHEKRFINDHGTQTAPWRQVDDLDGLDAAVREIGYPAVLKTRCGGYDGHGQDVLRTETDLQRIHRRDEGAGTFPPSILEGFVDFAFEASILVSGNGRDLVTFPMVRNDHRHNVLHITTAPAHVDPEIAREAKALALRLAKGFELAGTLAIELFITRDGRVVVNELAPRPHNSGHYTIEACSMSQFDAHIRGIVGWPLPEPRLLSPAVMVNILGQHMAPVLALIGKHPEWQLHDYGKAEVRRDRKMGHITVLTDDPARTVRELEATGCWDDLKPGAKGDTADIADTD